ncbi:MAG: ATP synthase F1 subunit gamma [bacterium]|nr:ATP synthase F1 subunit gamma [bacterium]
MESVQSIKTRLKSIHNIGQITKAMELVAATKMRKSQEIALAGRPYAFASLDLLAKISVQQIDLPPLLKKRKIEKTAFVIITSDKGLAGSFNSATIRKFEKYIKEENIDVKVEERIHALLHPSPSARVNEKYFFIAVGKKAQTYLSNKGLKITESFSRVGDFTLPEQTNQISDFISKGYLEKKWDEVVVFSTYFKSALKQEVLARKIFPIELSSIKKTIEELIPETGKFSEIRKEIKLEEKPADYLIEPSSKVLLSKLAWHLARMRFYHLILETNASEHAARRMAMKNASDNAAELSEDLTLFYNKSRQANITKEISEIVSSTLA